MTLFKQVALLVSLVYLLIVVTTTLGDFRRSGVFVEGQLQSTAQDMATTLGIAISNSASVDDLVAYETLFNAVFDSGYYTSIELIAPDGSLIHRKDRRLEIDGVPDWFISMVPLHAATGSTEVMRGWVPLGTLRLTMHPGYVYSSLYQNLESTLIWFLIQFTLGMIVLWILLHSLLRPLGQVKEQADAIHSNHFVKQSAIPRTIELRSVVEAMNRMVSKVQAMFEDQEETLASYQRLLYEDPLTGLGNRRYLIGQLERVQSEDTSFHGSMVVIKIQYLDRLRDQHGYEKSDAVIKALADILRQTANEHAREQCARLADEEFALLLPAEVGSATAHITAIFEQFKSSTATLDVQQEVSLIAGVTSIQVGQDVGSTLSSSDFALTQAESSGAYGIHEKLSSNIALPQGKTQWRNWLERCISEGKLFLVRQSVVDTSDVVSQHEIFVRLKNDDGQTVPAGMFIPMANALGMGEDIDRAVFKLVKAFSNKQGNVPLALNLTESVFTHADALVEFNQLLEFFRQISAGLCVEASHTILEQYPSMCVEVAESVRQAGHSFGIDNLNPGRSLQALQSVRPDYVKINAKMLYDLTTGDVPAGYQALRTLTTAMDIRLIAVAVDSRQLHDHLLELGVTTMQGNLLSEPEEIA